MKFDEFYNVKVENNKDLMSSKAMWILNGKTYSTHIKNLAEKFSKAYVEVEKDTCQKIEIESDILFEIKREGDNFFLAINGDKITDIKNIKVSLDKALVKNILGWLALRFTIYSKLVEQDVCYIVGEAMYDNKIAFKTHNDTNFITYKDFYLESWENCDELEILRFFRNYVESKDKKEVFDLLIEGEPGLAVFDNYIYIQNDKLYLTYKKSSMATEEEASDWKEQYGDFNSVEESETDAKTLAKQIIKIFNENKEQIIKHIPKGYEENFLKLLEE